MSTFVPSRRSFLKGIAALGGLTLVGPLCLLEERPKAISVALPPDARAAMEDIKALYDAHLRALGAGGRLLEGIGCAPNQATASPAALRYDLRADSAGSTWTDDFDKRLVERFRANIILGPIILPGRKVAPTWLTE